MLGNIPAQNIWLIKGEVKYLFLTDVMHGNYLLEVFVAFNVIKFDDIRMIKF